MSRPTFLEGAMLALLISLTAAILHALLLIRLPVDLALYPLITTLSLGYIVYLLYRSHQPLGRFTVFAAWLLATLVAALLSPSPLAFLMVQVAAIGLVRSLYFYSSVLSALMDFSLCGLGLGAAGWAIQQSGSIVAAVWCFFLVQALFVAIPPALDPSLSGTAAKQRAGDRFDQALDDAEAAVRKLNNVHRSLGD
ncbi:MAG: hypothetical protein KDI63_11935 [Gammaproteobacteria bacterium]|nr:hypothetical protein [Gammaproteobacteria bacterium]